MIHAHSLVRLAQGAAGGHIQSTGSMVVTARCEHQSSATTSNNLCGNMHSTAVIYSQSDNRFDMNMEAKVVKPHC